MSIIVFFAIGIITGNWTRAFWISLIVFLIGVFLTTHLHH